MNRARRTRSWVGLKPSCTSRSASVDAPSDTSERSATVGRLGYSGLPDPLGFVFLL